MKILVVDDEPDIVELVAFNLKTEGYEVTPANDGAAALNLAWSHAFDLIVLDLMLPELDGLGVCEMLRREPLTAATPILILTAWANDQARVLGFELGADDYLTKPFSPRELVLRVNRLLHGRKTLLQP